MSGRSESAPRAFVFSSRFRPTSTPRSETGRVEGGGGEPREQAAAARSDDGCWCVCEDPRKIEEKI